LWNWYTEVNKWVGSQEENRLVCLSGNRWVIKNGQIIWRVPEQRLVAVLEILRTWQNIRRCPFTVGGAHISEF